MLRRGLSPWSERPWSLTVVRSTVYLYIGRTYIDNCPVGKRSHPIAARDARLRMIQTTFEYVTRSVVESKRNRFFLYFIFFKLF